MIKKADRERALHDIGNRLKALRIKKGCATPDDFSRRYDIPRKQYSRLENGERGTTLTALLKVLDIHEMSLVDFFCFDSDKKAAA